MKHSTILLWLFLAGCTHKDVGSTTVYVTHTGKKYHYGSCRYLGKNAVPVSVQDAVLRDYKPCDECDPPVYHLPTDTIGQIQISSAKRAVRQNT